MMYDRMFPKFNFFYQISFPAVVQILLLRSGQADTLADSVRRWLRNIRRVCTQLSERKSAQYWLFHSSTRFVWSRIPTSEIRSLFMMNTPIMLAALAAPLQMRAQLPRVYQSCYQWRTQYARRTSALRLSVSACAFFL